MKDLGLTKDDLLVSKSIMLMERYDFDIELERNYLNYIWNKNEGIYYISNFPVSHKLLLEDKGFTIWLSALEALSGFSLFDEFLRQDIYHHLETQINLLKQRREQLNIFVHVREIYN